MMLVFVAYFFLVVLAEKSHTWYFLKNRSGLYWKSDDNSNFKADKLCTMAVFVETVSNRYILKYGHNATPLYLMDITS